MVGADDAKSGVIIVGEPSSATTGSNATVSVGRLEVIATPIGNLADLSPRARDSLAGADLLAVEDTRRTGALLSALGLQKPMVSLHTHNERARGDELIRRLQEGAVIAIVSDAGTPLLSDPGFDLVRRAAAAGITVRAIPGPTAIAAALSVAAIPAERFCFEGFLPARGGERRTRLSTLVREARAMVFFEAPHRISETLADMALVFGPEREAAVTRELTKIYESVYRGTLASLAERSAREPDWQRGEITLVVAGALEAPAGETVDAAEIERVVAAALAHLPASKAAALAVNLTGCTRETAYEAAVRLAAARR